MTAIELSASSLERDPSILGFSVGGPKKVQFLILSFGALSCAIGFSVIQEHVFRLEGFVYGGWMSFLTYFSWVIFSSIELLMQRDVQSAVPFNKYAIVSCLTLIGGYLTNWALFYIDDAASVVFKSSRVLPAMVLRRIVQGKLYSHADYIAAATLVGGICCFSLGDRLSYPELDVRGVVLILLAILCDAIAANLEENWFFSIPQPCTHTDVVHYVSLFSLFYASLILILTDEWLPAVEHSLSYPHVVPCILALSVFGYIGMECLLVLIQKFGAANAELIKSLKRVVQVSMSFLIFPKPFTTQHGIGALLAFVAFIRFEYGNKN